MAELSYFWDGAVLGDAGPYDGDDLRDYFRPILAGTGNEGVLYNWLNQLEVTDGGVDTADVDTGAAIWYGGWFESDAVENININAYRGGNCLIVVQASWAAQTARIVARAAGALTQTPGVTYEIPLAQIAINAAGAITLITDTRDYCEFSTVPPTLSVYTDNIQDGAVTWAKQIDQTRTRFYGAGMLEPDMVNPATWNNTDPTVEIGPYASIPYRDNWEFVDAATNSAWLTFRAWEDLTGAGPPHSVEAFIWVSRLWVAGVYGAGDQRWQYNLESGASGAVLANQTNTITFTEINSVYAVYRAARKVSLGTFTATAGDLIMFQVTRTGAHAGDTSNSLGMLFGVEFEYTAEG